MSDEDELLEACAGCDGTGRTCLECGEPEATCCCEDCELADCMYCFGAGAMPPQIDPPPSAA